jgi:hypothetical protein
VVEALGGVKGTRALRPPKSAFIPNDRIETAGARRRRR